MLFYLDFQIIIIFLIFANYFDRYVEYVDY